VNRIAILQGYGPRRGHRGHERRRTYHSGHAAARLARSRRRRFGGASDGFLDLPVKAVDVGIGAVLAIGALAALKWLLARPALAPKVPPLILRFQPAIAGAAAAAALYLTQRGSKARQRGTGHAIGAATAAVAFTLLSEAKAQWPAFFADIVDLRLAGVIVNDPAVRRMLPQMQGLIVDEPSLPEAARREAPADMFYSDLGADPEGESEGDDLYGPP